MSTELNPELQAAMARIMGESGAASTLNVPYVQQQAANGANGQTVQTEQPAGSPVGETPPQQTPSVPDTLQTYLAQMQQTQVDSQQQMRQILAQQQQQMAAQQARVETTLSSLPQMVHQIMSAQQQGVPVEDVARQVQQTQQQVEQAGQRESSKVAAQQAIKEASEAIRAELPQDVVQRPEYNNVVQHWNAAADAGKASDDNTIMVQLLKAQQALTTVQIAQAKTEAATQSAAQEKTVREEVMASVQPENMSVPGVSTAMPSNDYLAKLTRMADPNAPIDRQVAAQFFSDLGTLATQ